MGGDASAYAALGLEPDADPDEIERAYKKLIKRYHPDRGGDPQRAAEVNRAYRALSKRADGTIEFHAEEYSNKRNWPRTVLVFAVGAAGVLLVTGPVTALMSQLAPPKPVAGIAGITKGGEAMNLPIHDAEVREGIRDALRIARRRDEGALLSASRECHRRLRSQPSLERLDRCSAFDDAVVQLQNRDPMWDGGPFGEPAVTRRQWSSASALSNDYLAVDGRLDRIRLQVELALAPRAAAN
jgi:DnaJ-like protein